MVHKKKQKLAARPVAGASGHNEKPQGESKKYHGGNNSSESETKDPQLLQTKRVKVQGL